jgi:hypothetical protein
MVIGYLWSEILETRSLLFLLVYYRINAQKAWFFNNILPFLGFKNKKPA